MPELPEVEVTRLSFADRIRGAAVRAVRLGKPLRWPLGVEPVTLTGRRVLSVRRRGKYLLIDLDEGILLMHLGMSGSVQFADHLPPAGVHDHFDMQTSQGVLRLNDPRRFGAVVYVQSESDPLAVKLLGGLGVEPLTDDFEPEAFHRALRQRQASVKQVLMAGDIVVGWQHLCVRGAVSGGHQAHGARQQAQPAAGAQAAPGDTAGSGQGLEFRRQHAAQLLKRARAKRALPTGGDGLRPGWRALPGLRHADTHAASGATFHLLLPPLPEGLKSRLRCYIGRRPYTP